MSSNCVRCSVEITDEVLQYTYFDPAYPTIDIGPYCINCIPRVRICSGCHYPKIIDETIKFFGDGLHYCDSCATNIKTCGECGKVRNIHKEVNGIEYCESCFNKNFKTCDYCSKTHRVALFVGTQLEQAKWPTIFQQEGREEGLPKSVCRECFTKLKETHEEVEVRECLNCNRIYGRNQRGSTDKYCADCVEGLPKCLHCNSPTHNSQRVEVIRNGRRDVSHICPHCLKHLAKRCGNCNYYSFEYKKLTGPMGSGYVCHSCLEDGAELGKKFEQCPACLSFALLESRTGQCAKCTHMYIDNNCKACGSTRDTDLRCRVCGPEAGKIYSYGLKPRPQFHYTEKDKRKRETMFFGIENEVSYSSRDKMQTALKTLYKNFGPEELICKSDASISGYGFEIVTQPYTLGALHGSDITKMFEHKPLDNPSCGMHIHVSRPSFDNDLHIYKVTNFIHENPHFINMVARRDYNGYNRALTEKVSTVIKKDKIGSQTDRHVRVNLRNEKTIEFRMFARAVREFQVYCAVEFLHSLINWTRSTSLVDTSTKRYYQYVVDHSDLYPNIRRFLSRTAKAYI